MQESIMVLEIPSIYLFEGLFEKDAHKRSAKIIQESKNSSIKYLHNIFIQLESKKGSQMNNQLAFKQIEKDLTEFNATSRNSTEKSVIHLGLIKTYCFALIESIKIKNADTCNYYTQKILKAVENISQLRFAQWIIFGFNSLLSIQLIDLNKIQQLKVENKKKIKLCLLAYRIKLINRSNQIPDVLKLYNSITFMSIQAEKRDLQSVQNQLLSKKSNFQLDNKVINTVIKSFINLQRDFLNKEYWISSSTKRLNEQQRNIIKSFTEVNYEINLDNQEAAQQKIQLLSSEDKVRAMIISKIYWEKNELALTDLRATNFFRNLTTLSRIVQNPKTKDKRDSSPIQQLSKSFQKINQIPSLKYIQYLEASRKKDRDKHSIFCQKGYLFEKHNFGNKEESLKFFQLNQEQIRWSNTEKNIKESYSSCKLSDVVGIVYGKASNRFEGEDDYISQECFSFICHDRTIDITTTDEEKSNRKLNQFVRGSAFILNSFWTAKLKRIQNLKSKQTKSKNIASLQGEAKSLKLKNISFTEGKLMWKTMFARLDEKYIRYEDRNNKLFGKIKNILMFGKQIVKAQKSNVPKSIVK